MKQAATQGRRRRIEVDTAAQRKTKGDEQKVKRHALDRHWFEVFGSQQHRELWEDLQAKFSPLVHDPVARKDDGVDPHATMARAGEARVIQYIHQCILRGSTFATNEDE